MICTDQTEVRSSDLIMANGMDRFYSQLVIYQEDAVLTNDVELKLNGCVISKQFSSTLN